MKKSVIQFGGLILKMWNNSLWTYHLQYDEAIAYIITHIQDEYYSKELKTMKQYRMAILGFDESEGGFLDLKEYEAWKKENAEFHLTLFREFQANLETKNEMIVSQLDQFVIQGASVRLTLALWSIMLLNYLNKHSDEQLKITIRKFRDIMFMDLEGARQCDIISAKQLLSMIKIIGEKYKSLDDQLSPVRFISVWEYKKFSFIHNAMPFYIDEE